MVTGDSTPDETLLFGPVNQDGVLKLWPVSLRKISNRP